MPVIAAMTQIVRRGMALSSPLWLLPELRLEPYRPLTEILAPHSTEQPRAVPARWPPPARTHSRLRRARPRGQARPERPFHGVGASSMGRALPSAWASLQLSPPAQRP